MVRVLVVWMAGVCLLGSGCALYGAAIRNVCHEHKRKADDYFGNIRDRKVAKKVWAEIRDSSPDCSYSVDYAEGFKDGFADYVKYGAPDVPRPLPPRKYWRNRYQTPQGIHAMEDWFAGFDHGMATAREGGYRTFVMIPTQVPELGRVAEQYRWAAPPLPRSPESPEPPTNVSEEPPDEIDEVIEVPDGSTYVPERPKVLGADPKAVARSLGKPLSDVPQGPKIITAAPESVTGFINDPAVETPTPVPPFRLEPTEDDTP